MHWYLDVLRKYAVFDGRAGRPEFWWFQLGNVIASIVVGIVGRIVLGSSGVALYYLYSLAVFLPSLAVGIRRLHDTDKSGWWVLIGIIPIVGWIILIVFYATSGTPGPNRFGPAPGAAGTSAGSYCTRCGAPLVPGTAVCGHCGAATGGAASA